MKPSPRRTASLVRLPALLAIGLVALVAAGRQVAPTAGSEPSDEWHLRGLWQTFANGDDVRALARDGDFLWAATASGGVVRWRSDGSSLRQFLAPQDGLPGNDVRDLARWRGQWWFATAEGLAVYDAARDRMVAASAPLPSPSVTALAVDAGGALWVGSEQWWDPALSLAGQVTPGGWRGGGLATSVDGASWTVFGPADGLPSANVRDLALYQDRIWVATEPAWQWVPPSDDPDVGEQPGRWQASGGGLAERAGDTWRKYDSASLTELSDTARVLAARGETLWVGTGGRGLVAYHGGRWKALQDCGNDTRCIQDNFVTALAVGGDGAVWVGTARFNGRGTGIGVLDDRGTPTDPDDDAWHVVGAVDGLPGELVHAILPEPDATVWFGVADLDPQGRMHGRGLAHLLNDRLTLRSLSTVDHGDGAPAGNDVTALAIDPASGELWVGTDGAGLSVREPGGRWRTYTHASTSGGLGSDSIADLAIEPGGTVWVATRQTTFDTRLGRWSDGGLSRFDGAAWTNLQASADGLPSSHLSSLALDGRGKLWVGTGATDRGPKEHAYRGSGLAVVDTATGRWERTYTFPTLTSNNITDLAVSGNLLWVATSYFLYVDTRPGGAQTSAGGGVSVLNLDTGQWQRIAADQGLTVSLRGRGGSAQRLIDARAVLPDPATGQVWVGSLAYRDVTIQPDTIPDGVVDLIQTDRVVTHRFAQSGAVLALARDVGGFTWAATDRGGVRVWVGDGWLERARVRGGLPASDLTALSFEAGEVWLGSSSSGLLHLLGTTHVGSITPQVPRPPTEVPPPPVVRLPYAIFLPSARCQVLYTVGVLPQGGEAPLRE